MAQLLSMKEASERLSLSFWTVHRMTKSGDLRSVVIGRRRFIEESDLDAFIASARAETPRTTTRSRRRGRR